MPASKPLSTGALCLLALCVASAWLPAFAKTSDRTKDVHINANYADAAFGQPNRISHVRGGVTITQGTLKVTSSTATVYFGDDSGVRRVVLKGSPAHIQQTDDQGNVLRGRANTIDYQVSRSLAILTGQAWAQEPNHGTAQGHKLVYNTATSAMSAQSQGAHRVHLTFKPHQQTGASSHVPKASTPAAAGSTQSPPPAPAGSTLQPAAPGSH